MSAQASKNWKQIREVYVGSHRSGFLVKDDSGDLRLMVTLDAAGNGYEIEDFVSTLSGLVGLVHSNIARVYELTKDENGKQVAILEHAFGDEIVDILDGVSTLTFIAHFKQVFEALAFIHKLGLLHLHLSPRYVITDLVNGITKVVDCWHFHSRDNVSKGRFHFDPRYVAPEVVLNGRVDERSDLYSVGLLMLEAWGGGPNIFPFRTECRDKQSLRQRISEEKDPIYMWKNAHDYFSPPELGNELVLKLTKKNPDKRGFESAQAVVNYMTDIWPDIVKPANELYGRIMTTMR